jgi:hypothetical protein
VENKKASTKSMPYLNVVSFPAKCLVSYKPGKGNLNLGLDAIGNHDIQKPSLAMLQTENVGTAIAPKLVLY